MFIVWFCCSSFSVQAIFPLRLSQWALSLPLPASPPFAVSSLLIAISFIQVFIAHGIYCDMLQGHHFHSDSDFSKQKLGHVFLYF